MDSSRDFPYLNKIPGLERMDVPADDFVPRSHRLLTIWTVVFFVAAAASAVVGWGEFVGARADLLFKLFSLLFVGLGLITFFGMRLKTPVS